MPKAKASTSDTLAIVGELLIPQLPAIFRRLVKDEAKQKKYRSACIKVRDILLRIYPLEPEGEE